MISVLTLTVGHYKVHYAVCNTLYSNQSFLQEELWTIQPNLQKHWLESQVGVFVYIVCAYVVSYVLLM